MSFNSGGCHKMSSAVSPTFVIKENLQSPLMPLLLFLISAILAARDYLDFLISNKFRTLAHRVTISTFMANGNHCKLQSEMPSSAAVSVMWWMRLNPHKYFNFLDSGDQSPASSLQTLNGTFTNTNTFHTARGSTEYKILYCSKLACNYCKQFHDW